MIFIVPFQRLTQLGFYQTDLLLKDLGSSQFEQTPIKKPRQALFVELGEYISFFFKAIHNVFWGNVRSLAPLLIGAPVIFWLSVIIIAAVLWAPLLTPGIFLAVDLTWRAYFIATAWLYAAINQTTAFFYEDTDLWTELLDCAALIWNQLSRVEYVGDNGFILHPQHLVSVSLVQAIALFWREGWDIFFSAAQLFFQTLFLIFGSFGGKITSKTHAKVLYVPEIFALMLFVSNICKSMQRVLLDGIFTLHLSEDLFWRLE